MSKKIKLFLWVFAGVLVAALAISTLLAYENTRKKARTFLQIDSIAQMMGDGRVTASRPGDGNYTVDAAKLRVLLQSDRWEPLDKQPGSDAQPLLLLYPLGESACVLQIFDGESPFVMVTDRQDSCCYGMTKQMTDAFLALLTHREEDSLLNSDTVQLYHHGICRTYTKQTNADFVRNLDQLVLELLQQPTQTLPLLPDDVRTIEESASAGTCIALTLRDPLAFTLQGTDGGMIAVSDYDRVLVSLQTGNRFFAFFRGDVFRGALSLSDTRADALLARIRRDFETVEKKGDRCLLAGREIFCPQAVWDAAAAQITEEQLKRAVYYSAMGYYLAHTARIAELEALCSADWQAEIRKRAADGTSEADTMLELHCITDLEFPQELRQITVDDAGITLCYALEDDLCAEILVAADAAGTAQIDRFTVR